MERIKVLIDKLVEQQQRNEGVDAMFITVQLLQNELFLLQKKNTTAGTSKVAVVMPSVANQVMKTEPKQAPAAMPVAPVSEPVVKEPAAGIPEVTASLQPIVEPQPLPATASENPEHEAYLPPKPAAVQEPVHEPEKKPQPVLKENQFNAIEETPTLAQYQPTKKEVKLQKEINELIGESKETLNERLKEDKKELAHILKETPIKDLRKAIGVNDRFVFVNELFRGDETMYERSIKTINGFHILPEAEYWINRELKVKLGWDDYKDSVQHFYHLVRRRFS